MAFRLISWVLCPNIYGKIAPLVKQKQLRAPPPSGAVRAVVPILRQKAKRPRRENLCVWPLVVVLRPGVPEGDTRGPTSRGPVFPEGDIANPNAQRGYRRIGTVGVGLMFWCSKGGFLRFSASVLREPETSNCGLGLASCSRGLMFTQGDTTGPKSQGLVFPEGDIADPNVQRSYRPVGTDGFYHLSGAVRADSSVFPPTSKDVP